MWLPGDNWNHLGPSGDIWDIWGNVGLTQHFANPRPPTGQRTEMQFNESVLPSKNSGNSSAIWNRLWQFASIWGNVVPSEAVWCHLKLFGSLWRGGGG